MNHRFPSLSRFSLRTLFVLMTLLAVGLGWLGQERRTVQERNEVLRIMSESAHLPPQPERAFMIWIEKERLPWTRSLLGDMDWGGIWRLPENKEERARILSVFPDSDVFEWTAASLKLEPVDRESLK